MAVHNFSGKSVDQLFAELVRVEDEFDWDAPDEDLSLYTAFSETKDAIHNAIRAAGGDPYNPPARKPATKPTAGNDRGRYESTVPRPEPLPFERQQLDRTDLANMTEAEVTEAVARGQLDKLNSDPAYVNVDRLITEEAAKEAAALKAEWGRQEQARREQAAKEQFEAKLTVYNAERATKGLKPLEIGEQLDPKSFDVNKDLDAFTEAQANGSFLHAFGQSFEELVAGFEAYEVDQLTSKIDQAKEAFEGNDLDAKFQASRTLSNLTKGELELARKNGVRLDDSTVQQAGGEIQDHHRAQAEALYGD